MYVTTLTEARIAYPFQDTQYLIKVCLVEGETCCLGPAAMAVSHVHSIDHGSTICALKHAKKTDCHIWVELFAADAAVIEMMPNMYTDEHVYTHIAEAWHWFRSLATSAKLHSHVALIVVLCLPVAWIPKFCQNARHLLEAQLEHDMPSIIAGK